MKFGSLLLLTALAFSGCASGRLYSDLPPENPDFGVRTNVVLQDMIDGARQPDLTLGCVYFEFDKADLTPYAKGTLDRLAHEIAARSGSVIVEGHTDHENTDKYNQRLGYRRALAVADYLKSAGVWDERLVIHSFGEARPELTNWNETGRTVNRRVVLRMFAQGDGMTGKEAVKVKRDQYSGGKGGEKKEQTGMSKMMDELMKPASESFKSSTPQP